MDQAWAHSVAAAPPWTLVQDFVYWSGVKLIHKPLGARHASPLYLLVASIGASILVRHLIYLVADTGGWLKMKARIMVDLVGFVGYNSALRVRDVCLALVLLVVAEISRV